MNNLQNNLNMSDINNMSVTQIRNLLNADIAQNGKKSYHPTRLTVGGRPTKKALAYNRRLIREGKTTTYLDTSKFYNVDTKQFVNKPIDRRYKDKRFKKGFEEQHNIVGSTYSTKRDVFAYYPDDTLGVGWQGLNDSDDDIFSNDLIRQLIIQNNFAGNYRIIIQKNGFNLFDKAYNITEPFNKWWKNNKVDFQVDSAFMIWNTDLMPGDRIHIIFTKEKKLDNKYYLQTYLDGKISHCLLTPILDWARDTFDNAKTKSTQKKYSAIISKIIGKKNKEGYLNQYSEGVPENELPKLCEDLQIGMDIEQPFNDNLLFEYRSQKKPLKVFKYVNTRLNHVESSTSSLNDDTLFKVGETIKVDTRLELRNILTELEEQGLNPIYNKNRFGVTSIQTLDTHYRLKNEFSDTVREWEKEQGLNFCSVESVSNPELMKFINAGTHFNGTVDFVDTCDYKKIVNRPSDLAHIDMTKAYTQYKNCKWYNGFTMKITDFRKTDKMFDNGLYYIENLDLSKCHDKFIKLNDILGWYNDYNIYTVAELKALESYGGKFKVVSGLWGMKGDFEFSDDMINKKDITIFEDDEIKIPYYSKWAGMNCMIHERKNFYMKGDEYYFENINSNADIYYSEGEARISYPVKYAFNKKHITAQITAYQRLQMLEQLMNMDLSKIIRVCCDGIYYHSHDFKMNKVFSEKTKMTFNNEPCEYYLSGLIEDGDKDYNCENNFREHYKSEIFDSAGGDGKTYHNLFIDSGFINIVYAPHSNKLESRMKKDYMEYHGKRLRVTNHSRLLQEPFSLGSDGSDGECYKYNVYIIDECSMLTNKQKDYLLKHIKGKIIFCGDLKCQCKPIEGEPMTYKNIDNVATPSKINYRFKSKIQLDTCNYVRDCIINNKKLDFGKLSYKKVKKDFVKSNYSKEDIILVSRHCFNDEWTKTFKDIEKYQVKNNTRDYSNGDIIFEKVKKVVTELRHGYTIHSVQGETFKNKIFIDMRKMFDMRMFYTAISRAEYDTQIYLVH